MIVVEKLISLIGTNRTSYVLTFTGITLWIIGCTLAAERSNLSYGVITTWRGFLVTLIAFTIIRYQKEDPYIKDFEDNKYMLYRCTLTTINAMVFQVSLRYLPSPIVQTMANSGPIIVLILDTYLNNKQIKKNELIGTFMATISLLLTIYSTSLSKKGSSFEYIQSSTYGKIFIILITFASLIGWAFGMIAIKKIKRKGSIIISYHTGVWTIILGGLYSIFQQKSYPFNLEDYTWIVLIIGGLTSASAFIYILGLKLTENISTCSLINFVTVIEGYLLSYFRYREELSVLGVIGSIGIFVSLLYLMKQ